MLGVTFLGHQGWLFTAERARLLVDPLLSEPIGHLGLMASIFPPRDLRLASFPSVDAVAFTHEHEDHFNIPSVNRLARDVPIYVPARSSVALRSILGEMG